MFSLLYFYFWITTYFQHLINLIFLYKLRWLCNKLFPNLVAQTTTIIYYLSCFLWKGHSWASLGISHTFVVRCWLGVPSSEGLTGGRGPAFRVAPSQLLTVGHESQVFCIWGSPLGCWGVLMRQRLTSSRVRDPEAKTDTEIPFIT